MLKIAITGGIASGKSFLLKEISKYTPSIISADVEINKIYEMENILKRITLELGIDNPSKANIKAVALKEKRILSRLEKILYGELNKSFTSFERKSRLRKFKACFFEIPLLFEKNMFHKYDIILNIEVPPYLQRRRFLKRNGNLMGFNYLSSLQFSSSKKRALCARKKGISFLNIKPAIYIKNGFTVRIIKKLSAF